MRVVSVGVIRHGKLVPVVVVVQPTPLPRLPWQFAKLAPVTVALAALSTVTLNVEVVHAVPEPAAGKENPRVPESILPSAVPKGAQLPADATDGNTNAHNAITTPKSNMLFSETIFNI